MPRASVWITTGGAGREVLVPVVDRAGGFRAEGLVAEAAWAVPEFSPQQVPCRAVRW